MTLINESQNTVSRNSPAGQLTYKRKEYIFIPLSLHLHLHYSLCTEETETVAEWGTECQGLKSLMQKELEYCLSTAWVP